MQPQDVRFTIPAEIAKRIPAYNPERAGKSEEKLLYVSFRDDLSGSAYYVGEYDGDDLCWGLIKVINDVIRFDDFRLSAISQFRNNMLVPMHLDARFVPSTGLEMLQRMDRLGFQNS